MRVALFTVMAAAVIHLRVLTGGAMWRKWHSTSGVSPKEMKSLLPDDEGIWLMIAPNAAATKLTTPVEPEQPTGACHARQARHLHREEG